MKGEAGEGVCKEGMVLRVRAGEISRLRRVTGASYGGQERS